MGPNERNRGIQLRFGTITCSRCGGVRLLARTCPECGARPKPQEVQYDLQRRERVVAEFRARRLATETRGAPNLELLHSDFDRIVSHINRALSAAARTDRTGDNLVKAFSELDHLVTYWNQPLLRPERNRGRIVGQALLIFSEGIELFVNALTAPDLHAAQEFEASGNALIAKATSALDQVEAINDADQAFSGATPFETLNAIGRAVRESTDIESSVQELDKKLSEGTDWGVSAVGMGLQSHVVNLIALSCFDLLQFKCALTTSEAAASAGGPDMATSDEWKRSHARAAALLASSASSIDQVLNAPGSSDFEIVDRMVVAVAQWRDGVLKHALATMFANSAEEYDRLMCKKGGELIKKATKSFPELRLNENLTPELRNAGGHAGADIRNNRVLIQDVDLSFPEFIDKVLAYLETAMAAFVGVSLAVSKFGPAFECADYLAPRDRDAAIAMFLGSFGLTCESFEMSAGSVVIHTSGGEPNWMALAAALSAMLPDSIDEARLLVRTSEGEQAFATSMERFRSFSTGIDQLEVREVALNFAALVSASRLDAGSPWSDDEWTCALNAVVARDSDTDLRDWVQGVRRLREYGREAGQDRVVSACNDAIAELRLSRTPE